MFTFVTFRRNWEKNSKDDSTFRVWTLIHETFSTLLPNCLKVRFLDPFLPIGRRFIYSKPEVKALFISLSEK